MELKQDETGTAIVPVLACVLNQLCIRNDRLPFNSKAISKFHALRPPAISIKDYLHRIAKYALCSGECFVLALVYIDRIIQGNPTFIVNSYNIHRLLITSVMLAAKFFDDQYFNNAYYAKVGGVPCLEMNSLEVEFLFMTNFTLFVTTETYKQYYEELWNHANSNSTCGCSAAKVPVLVLPFEDLVRRRKSQQQIEAKSQPPDILDSKGGDTVSDVVVEGDVESHSGATTSSSPSSHPLTITSTNASTSSTVSTSTSLRDPVVMTDPEVMTDSPPHSSHGLHPSASNSNRPGLAQSRPPGRRSSRSDSSRGPPQSHRTSKEKRPSLPVTAPRTNQAHLSHGHDIVSIEVEGHGEPEGDTPIAMVTGSPPAPVSVT